MTTKAGVRPRARTGVGQSGPSDKPEKPDLYDIKRRFEADVTAIGRRELNKFDKLQRISAAAREQFAAKGYDGTTLRGIAEQAGVALGTIGFYAQTKQDLVLLIFNAAMTDLIARTAEVVSYERSLVDALIRFIRPIYATFAQDAPLYRILLRENVTSEFSEHAVEFRRHRGILIAAMGALIAQAQAAGEVRPYLDAELAARTAFFLLFASVRWWIVGENPDPEQGLREIRRMLALLIDGMRSDAASRF